VVVSWCLATEDEGTDDYNLCHDRKFLTHTIRTFDELSFTMVHEKLHVTYMACRAPSRPENVGFIDGIFSSTGCEGDVNQGTKADDERDRKPDTPRPGVAPHLPPANPPGPNTDPNLKSVCMRNFEKIGKVSVASGWVSSGATYDLFMADFYMLGARLMQPCISFDAKAKHNYDGAMTRYQAIKTYCSGQHSSIECSPWGVSGDQYAQANQRFLQGWTTETEKALSDPNYSAELGPARSGP
jgi:hypothetical protein